MRSRLLVAAIATLFALPVCAQQMYRWVDKDGKVNYSDKPPPVGSGKVEQRRMTGSVVEAGGATDFAVQQAAKNFPVTMYSAPTCQAPCVEARGVLSKRGVPFVEVVVTDEATREQLKKVSGDTQVPVLVVGRDVTKGYEIGMWNAALDSAGYPKSVAPNRQTTAAAPKPAPAKAEEPAEPARPLGPYAPK